MYYFIHFELTLKQMGKKLKVSLKQFHGYLYAVIILQFCKHTVLSTSSGAGTNISAYVLNFVLHKRIFRRKSTIALGCLKLCSDCKDFPFILRF